MFFQAKYELISTILNIKVPLKNKKVIQDNYLSVLLFEIHKLSQISLIFIQNSSFCNAIEDFLLQQ